MNARFYRLVLIALCAVLGFGVPVSGSFATKAGVSCTMGMVSGDGGSSSSDCGGGLGAACVQACGFASGMALPSDAQAFAPDFGPVLIPKVPDTDFASRTGPPLLQPPR